MTVPFTEKGKGPGKGPGLGRGDHELNILATAMNYGDLLL